VINSTTASAVSAWWPARRKTESPADDCNRTWIERYQSPTTVGAGGLAPVRNQRVSGQVIPGRGETQPVIDKAFLCPSCAICVILALYPGLPGVGYYKTKMA
jgi:hypothetical protein